MSELRVTLFAARACPLCETARAFLRARGIAFHDIEVMEEDEATTRELLRLAGRAITPTIVVNSDVQVGWDEARVTEMVDDPLPDEEDAVTVLLVQAEQQLEAEDETTAMPMPPAEADIACGGGDE